MQAAILMLAGGLGLVGCGRLGYGTFTATADGGTGDSGTPTGDSGIPGDSGPVTGDSGTLMGEIDPGFGAAGVVLYDYVDDDGVSKDDRATGVGIDGEDRIVVSASGTYNFYAADDQIDMAAITIRLTPTGAFDVGYQSGARSIPGVTTDSSGRWSHGEDVMVDAAGIVTMCGYREFGGTDDPALYRYQVGGQPSPTFGMGGLAQIPMAGEVRCRGMAIDPTDGHYVVVGEGESAMIVAKVRGDTGAPVTAFAVTGQVVFDVAGPDIGDDVVVDATGRIYVAGTTTPATLDVTVWRYLPDGTLDAEFGVGGIVRYDGGADDTGRAIALTNDGAVVVVGTSTVATMTRPLVLRLTTTGELDPAFGDGGVKVLPDPGDANNVVIDGSGTIHVTGSVLAGPSMAVWRLASTGALDTTFGTGGTFRVVTGASRGWAIAIDREGRLVVAGEAMSMAGFWDAAVWRLR